MEQQQQHRLAVPVVLAILVVAACCVSYSSGLQLTSAAGHRKSTQQIIDELTAGFTHAYPTFPRLSLLEEEETPRPLASGTTTTTTAALAVTGGPLTEAALNDLDPITNCPKNVYCPHPNGKCCPGGTHCCPDLCIGDNQCGTTAQMNALAVARKLMEEEGTKEILKMKQIHEDHEEGNKLVDESKRKEAREQANKEAVSAQEQKSKKEVLHNENESKQLARSQEENEKRAEARTKVTANQRENMDEQWTKKSEEQLKTAQRVEEEKTKTHEKEREVSEKNFMTVLATSNFHPSPGQIIAPASKIKNTGSYTYMFWIRPDAISEEWTGFLHKGRTNQDRNPSFYFRPNTTQLYIRSGTKADWNNGVAPTQSLPLHKWTHVTLTHRAGALKVYYQGQKVAVLRCDGPVMNKAPLTAMDTWDKMSQVTISDLRYFPIAIKGPEIRKVYRARKFENELLVSMTLVDRNIYLRKGKKVAVPQQFGDASKINAYALAFWIYPYGVLNTWSNIMHHGNNKTERSPGFWFAPRSTNLRYRTADLDNPNAGGDINTSLPLHQWTHVAISHQDANCVVYINGQKVAHLPLKAPRFFSAPLYASSPFYPSSFAYLADVRFVPSGLNGAQVAEMMKKRKYNNIVDQFHVFRARPFLPQAGMVIADSVKIKPAPSWTYMFWMRPFDTYHTWSQLLHKGENNKDRGPAIWLFPNSTRIHIRSHTSTSWDDGIDPDIQFPLDKWVHIAVTHGNGLMEFFVNGVKHSQYSKAAPIVNSGPLFACGSWFTPARAYLADVRYVPQRVTDRNILQVRRERKYRGYGLQLTSAPEVKGAPTGHITPNNKNNSKKQTSSAPAKK